MLGSPIGILHYQDSLRRQLPCGEPGPCGAVGGTSPNPSVVAAQKQAMKRYRQLECFYKRGEFYGISEEIHLHVLPQENAFVVNLFNLSDEKRTISGGIELRKMGLDQKRKYSISEEYGRIAKGVFYISRDDPG